MADLWSSSKGRVDLARSINAARERRHPDEGFSESTLGRADLQLAPLVNLELSLDTEIENIMRVTAMSNSGTAAGHRHNSASSRSHGTFECHRPAQPTRFRSGRLPLDVGRRRLRLSEVTSVLPAL